MYIYKIYTCAHCDVVYQACLKMSLLTLTLVLVKQYNPTLVQKSSLFTSAVRVSIVARETSAPSDTFENFVISVVVSLNLVPRFILILFFNIKLKMITFVRN